MKPLILSLIISIFVLFNQAFCVERMTIAVMELEVKGGLSANEASILTEKVREALFHTGKYTVLDRSSMDEILKEMGLSQTGCTSVECIVNVGRVLSAQNMVAGYIGKIGTTYSMALRIINVQTGEIINMATVDCPGCQLEQVAANTPRDAVRKLLGEPVEEETSITAKESERLIETKKPGKLPAKKRKYMITIGLELISVNETDPGGVIGVGYNFTPNFALKAELVTLELNFRTEESSPIVGPVEISGSKNSLNAFLITPRYYKKISGKYLWIFFQIKFGVFGDKVRLYYDGDVGEDQDINPCICPGLGLHLFKDKFVSVDAVFGYDFIERHRIQFSDFSHKLDYSCYDLSLNVVFSF